MKKQHLLILVAAGILVGGCATKGQTGALVGAGVGVGAGALIGGGTGAVIGGAAGAVGGGLIGMSLEDNEQDTLRKESPRTYRRVEQGERLSIDDIIALSQAGISDDKIIDLIEKTHSRYHLSVGKINRLRNMGVSERVIEYMSQT